MKYPRTIILLAVLLHACKQDVSSSQEFMPTPRDCSEFSWTSQRSPDLTMVCRVLWCVTNPMSDHAVGGPTTLWCEPIYKGVRGTYYYGHNVDPKEVRAVLEDAGPQIFGDRQ